MLSVSKYKYSSDFFVELQSLKLVCQNEKTTRLGVLCPLSSCFVFSVVFPRSRSPPLFLNV